MNIKKILNVNKFYYLKGGSERYYFTQSELLSKNGFEVIPFAMKDSRNMDTPYARYFVSNIDYYTANYLKKLKYAWKIIYSREAYKKIDELIKVTEPDIAHLHLFQHQLSPSILFSLKKHKIPVVYTVHDLKPMCANYLMLNKNSVCEDCKEKKYYKCLCNSCVKNSRSGSLVNTLEMYIHNFWKVYEYIDVFITPSTFLRDKMIEFGFKKEKIVIIPHFLCYEKITPDYSPAGYILYFGRLSKEKGLYTLIKAMELNSHITLKIAGEGALRKELEGYVRQRKLHNIEFIGFKEGTELANVIKNSAFVVCPSECYETFGFTILEAMAYGKPVIAANIGAYSELLENGKNGLLFPSGHYEDLAEKIDYLWSKPKLTIELGKYARKSLDGFHPKVHLQKLLKAYETCLSSKESSYSA